MPVDTTYSMLMGDVVLLESEFKGVLKKLNERGIDIAAIHNHLLNENRQIMYFTCISYWAIQLICELN